MHHRIHIPVLIRVGTFLLLLLLLMLLFVTRCMERTRQSLTQIAAIAALGDSNSPQMMMTMSLSSMMSMTMNRAAMFLVFVF
jgi:hypothetical protein